MTLNRADGTLTATWNAPANAAAYHVTYTTNNGQSWSLGAMDHTQTTWTLNNADNAATYIVGVRARNSANDWSGWTNSAAAGPYNAPSPPGAVAAVNVSRADGALTAAWSAPSGATKYHVTYTDNGGQSWHAPVNDHANVTATSITFSGDNAKTYVVGVRAGNDGGWSGWVNSAAAGPYVPPVTSPPAAPTGLSATAGDGSIVLSWDDPSDASISGYEYQVNHNATSTGKFSGWGAWQRIADSGAATTSHTLSGLTNGAEYRYRLRAVNAAGAGATAPNAKPWYVAATPDGAPSISVTHVTATSATLNLNNHSGAWYYQASGGSGGTQQAGASANSEDPPEDCIGPINGQANLTHLGANTTYTITVYGNQCQGGAIASGSFNTLQGTLADPTGIQVYRGYDATQSANARGTMDVEWGAVPNATGYKVAYTRNWHDFLGEVTVSGGSTTTAKITGFDHTTYYWVVVKATGANNAESGWGWSAISYAAMPPRPVYDMTLTRADAGLQVAWKQCNVTEDWCNSLSPVTGFQIDLSDDGGTTWTKVWEAASVPVTNYAPDANGITTGDASATVCANTGKSYRVRIGVTNRMATAWSEASAASSTVGTYTPTAGARHTACDFNTLTTTDNPDPRGIWSDGATMWVVDNDYDKVYAYDMATKARDTSKDISLGATKDWEGIASDGVTLWAGDNNSYTTIFAYNLATGARDSAKDLTMSGGNDHGFYLWTDGIYMWVHDQVDKKIYAYDLADNNAQDTTKTISLGTSAFYKGIWSDGTTMWVLEGNEAKAYAYTLASGARDSAKDYNTLDSLSKPFNSGIWSDGTTLWVADRGTNQKIYAYHSTSPVTLPPAAPATVNAYRGNGFVDADWTAVSGADGYHVEHFHPWNGQLLGQEWVRVASNTTATSIRVNRSNWPGDVIRVQAVKRLNAQDVTSAWAYSDPVPQVTTYPTAPGNVAAARISAGEIIVAWTQCDVTQASCSSGTPITHFHVEISTNNGSTWSRAKSLTSYTSGAPVSVTQGVTASVNRVRVGVDTRAMDAWTAVNATTPSLTSANIGGSSADLTLGGWSRAWYYKSTTTGKTTCESVAENTASVNVTGLTANTAYTFSAYGDSSCTTLLATAAQFTTPISLTASSISKTGATLTLAGHTGAWYYKRTGGPSDSTCHTVDSGTTATLGSLTANTSYTYTAYSATNCATTLDSVTFNTQLTVSNLSQSKDTYNNVGVVANQFRTGSNGGGYTLSSVTVSIRLKLNSPGRLQMQLWTDNGNNEPGSQVSGVTLSGSDPPPGGGEATYTCSGACSLSANTPYWVRLSASGSQGNYWRWNGTNSGNETLDPTGTGWSIGDNKLPYLGWTDLVGTSQSMQVSATAKPTLAASSVTKTTATLTLSHYSGPWWLKRTDPADTTCTSKGTTATESLSTLTVGTSYTYKAYSKDGCNSADEIVTLTFSTLNYTLTASGVTTTGATLTIGRGYNAQWWYKRTNPTGDNTCHSVAAGTTTASLSDLDGGTSYTYTAYSKDGCNSADEIVTLTFSTLNYTLTASGITATRALLTIGSYKTNAQWWYKRTNPTGDNTCHSVAAGTTTASLSGLHAYESHTYKAYDKANCNSTDEIQTVTFSTPISLTVSGIGTTGATLTIAGRTPPNPSWSWTWWYYKRTGGPADTTCTTVSNGNTATLGSLTANTSYTYTVYSGTNCWRVLNSVTFSTQLTVSNLSETTAANHAVGGIFRDTIVNQFRTGGNGGGYTLSAVTVDMGQKTGSPNPLQVQLWSDSSGGPGSQVSGATLSGSDPPSGGGETTYTCSGACLLSANTSYWVRLSVSGPHTSGAWAWNYTNSGDETLDPTGTGWSIGDNKEQNPGNLLTNIAGYNQLKVSAITEPTLAASSITTTTATLTLSRYSGGSWWLKRTTPADTTCKSKGTTATESLTTLTSGTSYTYKAYGKNGCHSADEIATVTFSATGSGQGSTTVVAGWRLERDGAGVLRVTAKTNAAPAASAGAVSTPAPGSRDEGNDVTTLAAAGNTSPDGLWSDGATLWVVDTDDRMLYAYDLASKARDPGNDVILSRNTRPLGLASDGITLWVSDYHDGMVYAYPVPGASSSPGPDVTLHADNASPSALWTDGATLWVAEDSDGRLYAYDLSDGLRDPGKDLTLHADNASSGGLWSDGVTMWVSDPEDGRVYAYRLSDGRRDASREYVVSSDSARVYGLWSDGWTLWVADDGGDRVLAHHAR